MVRKAQRSAMIRTTTAYRTVSFHALCILSGIMPIDLKAGMWREVYINRDKDRKNIAFTGNKQALKAREAAHRKLALENAMRKWQEEWDSIPQTNWTRRMFKSVGIFVGKDRRSFSMDYHIMQLLTGHGAFQAFKKRIAKVTSDRCLDCREEGRDDAEHVLLLCPTYDKERADLKAIIGEHLEVETLVERITKNERSWVAFRHFSAEVMKDKEHKERILERTAREERLRIRKEEMAAKKRTRNRMARKRKRKKQDTDREEGQGPPSRRRIGPAPEMTEVGDGA